MLLVKPLVLEFDEKSGKAQSTLDIRKYPRTFSCASRTFRKPAPYSTELYPYL